MLFQENPPIFPGSTVCFFYNSVNFFYTYFPYKFINVFKIRLLVLWPDFCIGKSINKTS